jgi:hypothetical protein
MPDTPAAVAAVPTTVAAAMDVPVSTPPAVPEALRAFPALGSPGEPGPMPATLLLLLILLPPITPAPATLPLVVPVITAEEPALPLKRCRRSHGAVADMEAGV